MARGNKLVRAGTAGVALAIAGASTAATSATIIVATSGAALARVDYGLHQWLAGKKYDSPLPSPA